MHIACSSLPFQISYSIAHDMFFRVHATHISHVVAHPTLSIPMQFSQGNLLEAYSFLYSESSLGESRSLVRFQRHFERSTLLLGFQDTFRTPDGSDEFLFYVYTFRGFSFSSIEFTSLHSLLTLAFHSNVHIPYTRELYRRGAHLQTPSKGVHFFYYYLIISPSHLEEESFSGS